MRSEPYCGLSIKSYGLEWLISVIFLHCVTMVLVVNGLFSGDDNTRVRGHTVVTDGYSNWCSIALFLSWQTQTNINHWLKNHFVQPLSWSIITLNDFQALYTSTIKYHKIYYSLPLFLFHHELFSSMVSPNELQVIRRWTARRCRFCGVTSLVWNRLTHGAFLATCPPLEVHPGAQPTSCWFSYQLFTMSIRNHLTSPGWR